MDRSELKIRYWITTWGIKSKAASQRSWKLISPPLRDLQVVSFLHDLGDLTVGEVHIVFWGLGAEAALFWHEGEHELPEFLDEGVRVELVTSLKVVVLEDAVVDFELEFSAVIVGAKHFVDCCLRPTLHCSPIGWIEQKNHGSDFLACEFEASEVRVGWEFSDLVQPPLWLPVMLANAVA